MLVGILQVVQILLMNSMDWGREMISVEIEDVSLILNVIDTYMEGLKEAKSASIEDDRTLDTPEKLLDSMASYDEDMAVLTRLKAQIINEAPIEDL